MPVKSLGRANGIVACGYLFGPAVGAYCGGLIMAHFGWGAPFWGFGGLSLLWVLPWGRGRGAQRGGPNRGDRAPAPGVVLGPAAPVGGGARVVCSHLTV